MEKYRTLEDIQAYSAGYAAAIADMVERENRRARRKAAAKAKRRYFFIQRLAGLALVILNIIAVPFLDYDITAALVLVPLGVYMIVTRERLYEF